MGKELYRGICFLYQMIESLEIDERTKIAIHKSINDAIEAIKG